MILAFSNLAFACRTLNDEVSLLRVDMRVDCKDEEYVYLRIAAVLLCVFVLGLPLYWLIILCRKKKKMKILCCRKKKILCCRKKSIPDEGEAERQDQLDQLDQDHLDQDQLDQYQLVQFSFLIGSYKPEYYLWEVSEMWRKVALTGLISVVAPGSMVQIIAASVISLGFLVMHARCYPYKDDDKNLLKLGTEVAIMLVFLCTALLRVEATKQALVKSGVLTEADLTADDSAMPTVISIIMVGHPYTHSPSTAVATVALPWSPARL